MAAQSSRSVHVIIDIECSRTFLSCVKAETRYATNRCDTSRRQVAPSLRQVASSALRLRQGAYFVTAICRTNSNQFEFVRQSRLDYQPLIGKGARSPCSNLSRRRVAAICRIVCLGLLLKLSTKFTFHISHVMLHLLFTSSGPIKIIRNVARPIS